MRCVCGVFVVFGFLGCSSENSAPSEVSIDVTENEVPEKVTPEDVPTSAGASTEFVPEGIQGSWVITGANMSGAEFVGMNGGTAEITGNKIVVSVGGQTTESTMNFTPATDPIQFESVNSTGERALAIMQVAGDEITVCLGTNPGAGHPTSFEPGPGLMIIKYKRQ